MKKLIGMVTTLIALAFLLNGCTTATYGKKLSPITGAENRYELTIATGGFAGVEAAQERLEQTEIPAFLSENPQYETYKIISHEFKLMPSGVSFIVEFYPKES